MSILQQVIQLNNGGVTCLTAPLSPQAQAEAFDSFKAALTILSRACVDPTVTQPGAAMASPLLNISIQDTPCFASVRTERRAFYMTSEETDNSYEAFTASSAVVMFNMALGLHCRGTMLKNSALLSRASYLYEHCLQLLRVVAQRFEGAQVLTAATLKNLADVHAQNGDYPALRCVLDSLILMDVRGIIWQEEQVSCGQEKSASAA